MKNNQIKTGSLSIERREFLRKTGAYSVMALFGIAFFSACSKEDNQSSSSSSTPGNPSTPSDNGIIITNSSVTIDLAKFTSLKNQGDWVLITSASMLVVNTGSAFSSLTSVCTHSGCDKNWSMSSNQFVCGCHGSKFSTSGSVLVGPASTPLKQYTNSKSGDILIINRA